MLGVAVVGAGVVGFAVVGGVAVLGTQSPFTHHLLVPQGVYS